jgi:sugar (pentulose or hexulose) kinase
MDERPLIAVLDIGKTNSKVIVAERESATIVWSELRANPTCLDRYRAIDVEAIGAFVIDALSRAPHKPEIDAIVPVAHGACLALLNGDRLALPVLDYEEPAVETVAAYGAERDPFDETFSPALPLGLNLGRQLAYLEACFPAEFACADLALPYPQYWAWLLSGVAASEATSLGCHSDLWHPERATWSRLATRRGWARRFPARRSAFDCLGVLRPAIARATGLPEDVKVLCGIHDSNASYLRHRVAEHRIDPAAVISTGTWTVVMASATPLARLDERRDMLANVDAFGDTIATARFMGGREYEAIARDAIPAGSADLDAVVARDALALPSFAVGGPYSGRKGTLVDAAGLTPGGRAALATAYLALMTDHVLGLIGFDGRVVIEGPLATKNRLYGACLASLRAPAAVHRSSDGTGTVAGACILAGARARGCTTEVCAPVDVPELGAYRERWRARIAAMPDQ